ncbi:MAG: hypothetical protein AB1714_06475 [Acidobacteriota bacterium]
MRFPLAIVVVLAAAWPLSCMDLDAAFSLGVTVGWAEFSALHSPSTNAAAESLGMATSYAKGCGLDSAPLDEILSKLAGGTKPDAVYKDIGAARDLYLATTGQYKAVCGEGMRNLRSVISMGYQLGFAEVASAANWKNSKFLIQTLSWAKETAETLPCGFDTESLQSLIDRLTAGAAATEIGADLKTVRQQFADACKSGTVTGGPKPPEPVEPQTQPQTQEAAEVE